MEGHQETDSAKNNELDAVVIELPHEVNLPPMIPTESGREDAPLDDLADVLGFTTSPQPAQGSPKCGLVNFGNTCYANSMLFALANLPDIRSWIYTHAHAHSSTECVLCNLAVDIRIMASSDSEQPHEPWIIARRRDWLPPVYQHLRASAQQD